MRPIGMYARGRGAGSSAEGRRALLVCSGRCPPDLKPSYCSKECQKQDWPNHRVFCKSYSSIIGETASSSPFNPNATLLMNESQTS